MASSSNGKIQVAVLGASGYSGAETLRLLLSHPQVRIQALTADRKAGAPIGEVFPQLDGYGLPDLQKIEDLDWERIDAVFCALPHGTTQEVIAALPADKKVLDLSADFRLRDVAAYATWYGHAHRAPDLQESAVYGLTEFAREAIAASRLIACPGCYPTSALLPLVPVLERQVIRTDDVIIDSKSGVSGAGRALKEASLYAEVAEGVHAYGIAAHRHGPEIEQELGVAAGRPMAVTFTPHLIPMNRGILSTIYVRLAEGAEVEDLRAALAERFAGEPFVRLLPQGQAPQTRHVRGSNNALIGVFADRVPGRALLLCAIDNLVKGAAGQAVQNFNVMHGLEETMGLSQAPAFP